MRKIILQHHHRRVIAQRNAPGGVKLDDGVLTPVDDHGVEVILGEDGGTRGGGGGDAQEDAQSDESGVTSHLDCLFFYVTLRSEK